MKKLRPRGRGFPKVPRHLFWEAEQAAASKLKALLSKPLSLAVGQENSQAELPGRKRRRVKAGRDFLSQSHPSSGQNEMHLASVQGRPVHCAGAARQEGGLRAGGQDLGSSGRAPVPTALLGGAGCQGVL